MNGVSRSPTSGPTVAGLRAVLGRAFGRQRAATCILRMREAGLLPEGRPGRGRSAEITLNQAARAVIVLALDNGDAHEAVKEAPQVTLLHGSAGWRRELGGVGRRPLS